MNLTQEAVAIDLAREVLAANKQQRNDFFVALARYESAEDFEDWCATVGSNPQDEHAYDVYISLHRAYMVLIRKMGWRDFEYEIGVAKELIKIWEAEAHANALGFDPQQRYRQSRSRSSAR